MSDLTTSYLNLSLKTPLIVASSRLTGSLDSLRQCEEAGAGAVVLKSMFEEQIFRNGNAALPEGESGWHPEAEDYVRGLQEQVSAREYLNLVKNARAALSIPVIASLNCTSPRGWTDYARQLENSGAQALELNIAFMPVDSSLTGDDVRNRYYDIVDGVRTAVKIPVSVKLGPYFTSLANVAAKLQWHGVDGLVLFNRFYRFDIDVENLLPKAGNAYSSSDETAVPLRWISLLSYELEMDLAASTGIHTAEDALKHLLAGACVVQLCSTLFLNGFSQLRDIEQGIRDWMEKHRFKSIKDFRGRLQKRPGVNWEAAERIQYIKALVGMD